MESLECCQTSNPWANQTWQRGYQAVNAREIQSETQGHDSHTRRRT